MPPKARIVGVCLPTLLVSSVATVALGLFMIWTEDAPEVVEKLVVSAFLVMVASGFVLSALRGIESAPASSERQERGRP